MWLYLSLTGGRGEVPMRVELVDVDGERSLFAADFSVRFQGPQDVVQLGYAIHGVAFPTPGEYRWLLTCGGEPVAERRLWLIQGLTVPGPPGGATPRARGTSHAPPVAASVLCGLGGAAPTARATSPARGRR
jgi:hypothetical protein